MRVGRRGHGNRRLVKVRLLKAQNLERTQHDVRDFCFQTHLMCQELVKMFGKDSCVYLSVGDKARVPISLTTANKQAALMMHVDYKVHLPDHDFVKATKHKLIPSVNALCLIKEDG